MLKKYAFDKYQIFFSLLLLLGIFVRIYHFGFIPNGINQDEAFAGYEAYSLLNYGKDSSGYPFPVYFTTWGSGMNALEIYFMIPFIRLLGLSTLSIRLPQLIISILSLIVVYVLSKKIFCPQIGLISLFLMSICPWQIMMSRWALESNLTPGFLILGLYFFVLGTDKPKFFILSALFYGLSLYCYATIWLIVPFIILLQIIYSILYKKIYFCKETILSFVLLFVLALPLLLFLLINYDILPEIKTSWFSIPRLVSVRGSEVSLNNIAVNLKHFLHIIFYQSDNYSVISTSQYGIFYHITLPLFFVGFIILIKENVSNFKNRIFSPSFFLLLNFIAAAGIGLMLYANLTKVNSLYLPMIIITAYGLFRIGQRKKIILQSLCILYTIFFMFFSKYYFTDYEKEIRPDFYYGASEMLEQAMTLNRPIKITKALSYPVVLFYTQTNVNEYLDSVIYSNYPSPYLDVEQFSNFYFISELTDYDENAVYILDDSFDSSLFLQKDFNLVHSEGNYFLAYKD